MLNIKEKQSATDYTSAIELFLWIRFIRPPVDNRVCVMFYFTDERINSSMCCSTFVGDFTRFYNPLVFYKIASSSHMHKQTHMHLLKPPCHSPLGGVYAFVNLLVAVVPLWDQQLIGYLQMSVML